METLKECSAHDSTTT